MVSLPESLVRLLRDTTFLSAKGSGKVACVPGWRWDARIAFVDFDVWYVLSGKGRMTLQGCDYFVERGDCLILRPGDMPQAVQDEEDRLTVIYAHFHMEHPEGICLLPPRHTRFDDRHDVEWLLHRLVETDKRSSVWRQVEFDHLLRLLWIRLWKQTWERRAGNLSELQIRLMKKAAKLIHDVGGMTDIPDLARQCELSPAYMSRLFTAYSSVPLRTYIVRVKLERAKSLLSESSLSVSQVAFALGYADVYVFSKLFKKYFGVSPSQYAAQAGPTGTALGSRDGR